MRTLLYTVLPGDDSKTASLFLKENGYSTALITRLKQAPGSVRRNGRDIYMKELLSEGDELFIRIPDEEENPLISPVFHPFGIIYEDDDILVVDKPAGLPVHPSIGHQGDTLANAAAYYMKKSGQNFVFRAIGRLDRDTSGLLTIAKHALSACVLGEDLKNRRIRRIYLAAARGDIRDTFPDGHGIIDAPICRVPGSIMERQTDPCGDAAVTELEFAAYNPVTDTSLVLLSLKTGRTHQIRVHLKYIGHPLPGDFLYNPDYTYICRQSLHSLALGFAHPVTKGSLFFTSPLPDDMKVFLPKDFDEAALSALIKEMTG